MLLRASEDCIMVCVALLTRIAARLVSSKMEKNIAKPE